MTPGEMYPCVPGGCPHRVVVNGFRFRFVVDVPTGPTTARAWPSGSSYEIELLGPAGAGGALRSLGRYPAVLDPDAPPDAAGALLDVRRGPFARDHISCPLLETLASLMSRGLTETDIVAMPPAEEVVRRCEAAMRRLDPRAFAVLAAAAEALAEVEAGDATDEPPGGIVH